MHFFLLKATTPFSYAILQCWFKIVLPWQLLDQKCSRPKHIVISHVAALVHLRDERWLHEVQEKVLFIYLLIYSLVVVVRYVSEHV